MSCFLEVLTLLVGDTRGVVSGGLDRTLSRIFKLYLDGFVKSGTRFLPILLLNKDLSEQEMSLSIELINFNCFLE